MTGEATPSPLGALAGLKVIDIASLYAAPLAATIMADHGADVIKIEPPGGDPFRAGKLWPLVARGKTCLELDLRAPEARHQQTENDRRRQMTRHRASPMPRSWPRM